MRHLGLFEGIGGFALAARWVGWETVAWVEIDKFCQAVLKKNFREAKGYGDIKQFDGTKYRGAVDILTGGFPCQPFSVAGDQKAQEDDRHLWPEMLRVIREVKPPFIVGENVAGIINLALDEVLASLEAEGYKTETFIIPACAVNAPHRRDRVWIIAYCYDRLNKHENKAIQTWWTSIINGSDLITTNTNGKQRRERRLHSEGIETSERYTSSFYSWNDRGNWKDFPTQPPICGRNDGISHRMDRIKALGNAIVPQVAFEIFKAIEQVNTITKIENNGE